jgi:hypothetical protein
MIQIKRIIVNAYIILRGVVAGHQRYPDTQWSEMELELTIVTFSMTPVIRTHVCKVHILVILRRE